MSSDRSNFQPEVPMAEGTRHILMDSSTDVSAADESRKRVLDSENASEVELDGELMSSLRKAVSMTTKKCLSAARYQQFQSYFEQIKKKYPKALKSIQTQFLQQLEAAISDEISKMYSEENIVGLMNQLEELSEKSDPDKTAWRPSGVVTDDVRAHLLPLKQKHAERLRKLADKLEQENSQLRAAVEARRKRFLATRRAILDSVSRIEMAHVACEEYPVEPLVDFVQSDGHKIHWLG